MQQLNRGTEQHQALKERLRNRIQHIRRVLEERHEIVPEPAELNSAVRKMLPTVSD